MASLLEGTELVMVVVLNARTRKIAIEDFKVFVHHTWAAMQQ